MTYIIIHVYHIYFISSSGIVISVSPQVVGSFSKGEESIKGGSKLAQFTQGMELTQNLAGGEGYN